MDTGQCQLFTATVEPMQLVLDPEILANEVRLVYKLCLRSYKLTPQLTVTLTSPGLPNPLPGESFYCHLADGEGRFPPIIVPAVEVTPGTVFSCDIEGLVPDYPGMTATINLGFQSSLPFDITNQALTIYRCSAGERYAHIIQYSSYKIKLKYSISGHLI